MIKNFRVGQSNELLVDEELFDLHNLYDFDEVIVKASINEVKLSFVPNEEFNKNGNPIILLFENIRYMEFSEGFFNSNIDSVDELGYKSPQDRDDNWLCDESHWESNYHFFIRFFGDEFLRVNSERASLIELN
ncbi:hypothetical protein [Pseudoalteromonas piscicida]|uniref:hypothetical protein n=1 Tax=Pseudoalteromonas piscicida TaxID=43662 RepID=UPI003C7B00AD